MFHYISDFEVITVPESIFYVLFNGENHLFIHKEIVELEQYEDVYFIFFEHTNYFLKLQLLKMT